MINESTSHENDALERISDKFDNVLQALIFFSIDLKSEHHDKLLSFFTEVKEIAMDLDLKELSYACFKNEAFIKKNMSEPSSPSDYIASLTKRFGTFKIMLDEIYKSSDSLLEDQSQKQDDETISDTTIESMGRVLVLDDEALILNLIDKALHIRGFEVRVTSSSKQALEILRSREVDVLILDLVMPDVSGLDFYKMLKEERIVVPTILLTASQSKSDHVQALIEGIDDFIRKPFDSDILIANVEKLIKKENAQKFDFLIDGLTSAYTRNYFSERFTQEKSKFKREGSAFTIVFMDLDYFKQINDTYGHSFGDEVLITFVDVFKRHLRPADQIFRFGGDEFLLLLPETEILEAYKVVERVREIFQNISFKNDASENEIRVTFSAGISSFDKMEITLDQAIDDADRQLYHSKARGRACTSFLVNQTEKLDRKKVLICDDSSTVSKLIKSRLTRLGLEVLVTYTGKDTLALISTFKPHLLILDIILPDLNGDQLLSQIKALPDHKDLKVVLISVKSLGDKKEKLNAVGYDDFIKKPISMELLEQSVKRLL